LREIAALLLQGATASFGACGRISNDIISRVPAEIDVRGKNGTDSDRDGVHSVRSMWSEATDF